MLAHDITNGKYYKDGVEIAKAEYDEYMEEWERNLPPKPTPVDDVDAEEALDILLGGVEND